MTEIPTNGAQPDAVSTPAADGAEAGSAVSSPSEDGSTLTLAEINQMLGKQYKDKATALKSLQDMSSMAGRAADLMGRQNGEQPGNEENTKRIEALELDNFFARNPEHEANKTILEALAKANNISIQKATELEAYQDVVKRTAKSEKRTVVDSKPRQQSAAPDKAYTEDFAKAKQSGDPSAWGKLVVDHVLTNE